MAYSSQNYTGDNTAFDFAVNFSYLDPSHVRVSVNKVLTTAVGSDYKFSFNNPTSIRVDTVVGNNPVPAGLEITVSRVTPINTPAVVFGGGASLSSSNLNKNSEYLTFALQEATDANEEFTKLYLGAFATDPVVDNEGDALQAGAVYYNSADTALNYWTGSTWIVGESTAAASVFRDAAEAARDAAVVAQAAAEGAAAAAASDAAAVINSAVSDASASATAASGSATGASNSATAADSSATASASSATASDVSAQAAAASAASFVTEIATQAEAEAGVENTKAMSSLRVSQAIVESAMGSSIGVGQTWQDVSGSRAADTSYQNTTGRPIGVCVYQGDSSWFRVSEDNATWLTLFVSDTDQDGGGMGGIYVIPDNYYYIVTLALGGGPRWHELR